MPKQKVKKTTPAKKKSQKTKKKNHFFKYFWVGILLILIFGLAFLFFKKNPKHSSLKNTAWEENRIKKIIHHHQNKAFGIDLSHYQKREDIDWDSLIITENSQPIDFVILRATMGSDGKDKNFKNFWKSAKKHHKIRGAYHFYRPNEDPVKQANNFVAQVQLEKDDLPPVLDIEHNPKDKKKLIKNLKIWCNLIERAYGKKPILYTYYHYYKDYLKGNFDSHYLWLANYNNVIVPTHENHWDFWQFTEKGIVQGIKTKVDLNIFNGSYQDLQKIANE